MKKTNDYGNIYHQMNFAPNDLMIIRDLCLSNYDGEMLSDSDYTLLNIIDRIERELEIK